MKKFNTFTAGDEVPSWMFNYKSKDTLSEFNNRKAKITFARSVIAVSDGINHTKLIPVTKGEEYIKVRGMSNATIGGVNGATGVHILGDNLQSGFGEGLVYIIGNSGKPICCVDSHKVEEINETI